MFREEVKGVLVSVCVWRSHEQFDYCLPPSLPLGHPKLEPKNFIEADTAELYSKDYLFMSCIKHINSVS